ncbi:MAG: tetratricopeptide repeat protein [Rhizobiales bacterium]|nr:tetratricopeptide repeat protein [Hyphomicrobiales bacterium]
MRVFFVVSLVAALLLPAGMAAAQDAPEPVPPAASPSAKPEPPPERTMDELFAALADHSDEAAGRAAEEEIQRRWLMSGSDTVDLLMLWTAQAFATKDYATALDYLDAVTMLKPDYVEGWNRRATIFYLQDDYAKAIADIEKVLALEPKHFGALAGLGLILHDLGRDADALAALERALAIDPYLDGDIKETIEELRPAVEGESI